MSCGLKKKKKAFFLCLERNNLLSSLDNYFQPFDLTPVTALCVVTCNKKKHGWILNSVHSTEQWSFTVCMKS